MKLKKIQIKNYIFNLKIDEENELIFSGHFTYKKNHARDITKQELKDGRAILEDIFNGKYNNRVFKLSNEQIISRKMSN